MKINHLFSLFVSSCIAMSMAMASLPSDAPEDGRLTIRPVEVKCYDGVIDEATKAHLDRWINTCDRLRDRMLESVALIRGSTHKFDGAAGFSIGTLSTHDQDQIANLEGTLKELSFLTVYSVQDVFSSPLFHTRLEDAHKQEITDLLSTKVYSYTHRSETAYPQFIAIKFPFKFSFGRKYVHSVHAIHHLSLPLYPNSAYCELLKTANPSISASCVGKHLDYDSIHISKITEMLELKQYSFMHFLPQATLERVKVLSEKMLQHFAEPYWHGADKVTPEIATHLMLKINDKCNDLVLEPDSALKQSQMAKLKTIVQMIEGALLLPRLYEETFINTQKLRYLKVKELKDK